MVQKKHVLMFHNPFDTYMVDQIKKHVQAFETSFRVTDSGNSTHLLGKTMIDFLLSKVFHFVKTRS